MTKEESENQAWNEYNAANALAWERYWTATRQAPWALAEERDPADIADEEMDPYDVQEAAHMAYQLTMAPVRAEYERATGPARAVFEAIQRPARAIMDAADREAWAVYQAAAACCDYKL